MRRDLFLTFIIIGFFHCSSNSQNLKKSIPEAELSGCFENESDFTRKFQSGFSEFRENNNILIPVRDPDLERAAHKFANILREKKSIHYEYNERPLNRLKSEGIKRVFVAENIAKLKNDHISAVELIEKWKNSYTERNNMLNSKYQYFGFAVSASKKYCYCVLLLTD